MYQPAAYAAVRHFTTPKTAAMGYAMLYALMNAALAADSRLPAARREFPGVGIPGTFCLHRADGGLLLVTCSSSSS
jgi:hypothetical protein